MKITWYETLGAYWLQAEDGRTTCCGDGVDMFIDGNGDSLEPGTDEFNAEMDLFCGDEAAVAYFEEV
jgi:hypothetical protein